ncbi:MAG TPA: hypothetical protein PLW77_00150 [Bacteroidales bacterium]|nr:hypothetical protein [Bacteroidales bacterium]
MIEIYFENLCLIVHPRNANSSKIDALTNVKASIIIGGNNDKSSNNGDCDCCGPG